MLDRVAQSVVSNNRRKRKHAHQLDAIELSLSDLEEDRQPVQVRCTVETVSQDRRRVSQQEHNVSIHVEKTAAPEALETPADDFFFDLGTIDIDAVQTEKTRLKKDDKFERQRYVSSVSRSHSS